LSTKKEKNRRAVCCTLYAIRAIIIFIIIVIVEREMDRDGEREGRRR